MNIDLEIFLAGRWQCAGAFVIDATHAPSGHLGDGVLGYDGDYALSAFEATDLRALSCRYPVGIEHWRGKWPAFLLDLMPSGYGRQKLGRRLGITPTEDGPHRDVDMLLRGAGNPIGNVRVAQAAREIEAMPRNHPGFAKEDLVQRTDAFLEYAETYGMIVAGESGVSGESPKMLAVTDTEGRWHADGVVPDSRATGHYIVKYDRGRDRDDRLILENEAPFLEVARALGLRVAQPLEFRNNTLIVPRFDRRVAGGRVERLGQESLYSIAGIAAFGADARHEQFCEAIARFSTAAKDDLAEYVLRDILNIALGNKDNHGRNMALGKDTDGSVRLAPVFDFCPMYKSNSVITRRTRWSDDNGSSPDWAAVANGVCIAAASSGRVGLDPAELRIRLAEFGGKMDLLPDVMRARGVSESIIDERRETINALARDLKALRPAARG